MSIRGNNYVFNNTVGDDEDGAIGVDNKVDEWQTLFEWENKKTGDEVMEELNEQVAMLLESIEGVQYYYKLMNNLQHHSNAYNQKHKF